VTQLDLTAAASLPDALFDQAPAGTGVVTASWAGPRPS
jgi:hypothetical protein